MPVSTRTLRVAAAQPVTIIGDVRANALAHSDAVRACAADVVVFPEMSLTGYCVDAPTVDVDDPALVPLIAACRERGSTALVGAAVRHGPRPAIGILAVGSEGTQIVYRKMNLGTSETGVYEPGESVAVVEVSAWRIGLGICKDTRIDQHIEATMAEGIDLYAAGLVHAPNEIGEFDVRARRIAATGGVPVVFAGFAGPTGGGFDITSGGSAIWDAAGRRLTQASDRAGEHVVADVEITSGT